MRQRLEAWRASPEGAAWGTKRGDLPVVQIRDPLLAALEAADVAVVGGDTGCGKTTQVPHCRDKGSWSSTPPTSGPVRAIQDTVTALVCQSTHTRPCAFRVLLFSTLFSSSWAA